MMSELKIAFQVILIGSKSVLIKLVYLSDNIVDINCLNSGKSIQYNDITISIYDSFSFNKKQFILPYDMSRQICDFSYEFDSELERYNTLKKYYEALSKWATNVNLYPNELNDEKKVQLRGKYWFIT